MGMKLLTVAGEYFYSANYYGGVSLSALACRSCSWERAGFTYHAFTGCSYRV